VSLEQLYQQVILDHYKEKHGHGVRPVAPGQLEATSHQYNPLCGDEVTLQVAVSLPGAAGGSQGSDGQGSDGQGSDGPVVQDVAWVGEGCSISQASSSVLYDLVVGQSVARAEEVAGAFRAMVRSRGTAEPDEDLLGDAVAFSGVGRHANRVKCAMLGWTAFEDALHRALAQAPAPQAAGGTDHDPKETESR
jgi:nitrogen fixation protein NifU and related proteins